MPVMSMNRCCGGQAAWLSGYTLIAFTSASPLRRDKLKLLPVSFLQQDSFSLEKQHSEDRL
jgi:hypothetical protein